MYWHVKIFAIFIHYYYQSMLIFTRYLYKSNLVFICHSYIILSPLVGGIDYIVIFHILIDICHICVTFLTILMWLYIHYMSNCNWQYSYFYYILSILLYAVITFLIFDNCNCFCGNMYTYIIILMDHIHIFHMSNF